MAQLVIKLLGGFNVTLDGGPVTGFDSNKVRALLAYLAVESDRAHRRESLATLLWPGFPERSARTNLRNALSNLRTAIGDREAKPPFLLTTRETVQLNLGSDHQLDVATLARAAESPSSQTLDALIEAVELYAGDFLAGFTLVDTVAFDDWAAATRERVRRQAIGLLGELADRLEADGDAERAITYALRRVELAPWQEDAQRNLIRLLAETGQRSAALRQYRTCVRALEEELGAEPSAETVALYEEIRAGPAGEDAAVPSIRSSGPAAPDRQLPAFLLEGAEPGVREQPVFVGREPELARLNGYLDAALTGQGQVAFVVGGPGRGKTALLRAFAERAMDAHLGLLVIRGACNAYSGEGDAYLPFRDAFEMLTGDVERQWRAGSVSTDHARRLWAALPETLPALVAHGPHVVGSLVAAQGLVARSVAAGLVDAGWMPELRVRAEGGMSAGLPQEALFQQVTNTLDEVSRRRSVLMVLDDLQWADRGSAGLLFHLGRRLGGARILLVGAHRPVEAASAEPLDHPLHQVLSELRRVHGNAWLSLREADAVEGRDFVDKLLDTQPNRLSKGFREALAARTGGHPLYAVELLRELRTRGDLVWDKGGGWREGAKLDWDRLPARVEAAIEQHIGRLREDERDLLMVASVQGQAFSAETVAEVQGLRVRGALRMLRELGRRHRLVRAASAPSALGGPESAFEFEHGLFQSYLYGQLSVAERRLLHGAVAHALERLYGEESGQVAVQLAHHYDQAGMGGKAAQYSVLAGDRALTVYANDEARLHYERVLALLQTMDPDSTDQSHRLAALSGLGKLCFHIGEVAESEQHLSEAIALGRQLALDPQEMALLYHWLGEALWWQSKYQERLRIGEEGLKLLGDDTESLGAALLNQLVGIALTMLGDEAGFREYAQRTAGFIENLPYVEELRPAYNHITLVSYESKDVDQADYWLTALARRAEPHGDLVALWGVDQERSNMLMRTGDLLGAITQTELGMQDLARGDTKHASWTHNRLATLHRMVGNLQQAERSQKRALGLGRLVGFGRDLGHYHCSAGQVALCRGDWKEAAEAFAVAEKLYAESHSIDGPAECRYLLGRAFLAAGDGGLARQCFEQGLLSLTDSESDYDHTWLLVPLLSGHEETFDDLDAYQAWAESFRERAKCIGGCLQQWHLLPVDPRQTRDRDQSDVGLPGSRSGWRWEDTFGDCGYDAGKALVIRATNGRHLGEMNLSAPRLLRDWPADIGAGAVQTTCGPALADRPAIGGLLLWRTKEDYLWLEVGRFGKRDVDFGGCIGNKDLVIGRGRLPGAPGAGWEMGERVTLRLEIDGDHVKVLCTLDGEQWYSVGHTTFPMDDTVQVGVHAIGMIDRTIHHGAYPDGTAIRFTDFRMWADQ